MMKLPRGMCKEAHLRAGPPRFDMHPLQLGMGGSPWRVGVACILMNRGKRERAEPALRELLRQWPGPEYLARAVFPACLLQSLGFQNHRARLLARFSVEWLGDWWEDMRELPGVGAYAADAVGLCCFGCTDLESNDHALHHYRELRCAGDAGLSV